MAKGKQEVSISIEQLEQAAAEVTAIDEKLSAASGSEAGMKKSVAERLASENADQVEQIVGQLVEALKGLDTPVLVGVTGRISNVVDSEFKETIDTFLTEEVKKVTVDSDVDVSKLREDRKAGMEKYRAVKNILEMCGVDTSTVPEPKRLGRGPGSGTSTPKSGKNKENYRFYVDGNPRSNSTNSISSITYFHTVEKGEDGKDTRWTTKQMKQYLADNGVNFGEDDEWEVTLPNGKKIGAKRVDESELEAEAPETAENTAEAA